MPGKWRTERGKDQYCKLKIQTGPDVNTAFSGTKKLYIDYKGGL